MDRIDINKQDSYHEATTCIYGFFWVFVALAAPITALWYSFFPDVAYSEVGGVGTIWLHETSLDTWMQMRFWELLAVLVCAGLIVAGCLRRWRLWQIGMLVAAIVAVWLRWWFAM